MKSAISDIDNAHERLMRTARMAFDAQNFTLRPSPAMRAALAPTEPTPHDASTVASDRRAVRQKPARAAVERRSHQRPTRHRHAPLVRVEALPAAPNPRPSLRRRKPSARNNSAPQSS